MNVCLFPSIVEIGEAVLISRSHEYYISRYVVAMKNNMGEVSSCRDCFLTFCPEAILVLFLLMLVASKSFENEGMHHLFEVMYENSYK